MESFNRKIYQWIYPDLTLERIIELRDLVIEKKDLFLDYQYYFETRPYLITRSIRHALAYTRFTQAYDLSQSEKDYIALFYPEITSQTISGYFSDAFNLLASPEQISFYMHLIDSYQIIGSYSQSELGNGSNLQAIETQAIYDHERQVFIINSPTITSSKYWIGGLGVSANFTIIVARLIIEDVDYGPHPFLMQIRNLRTHKPVTGAFLGEIGPKMGLESSDKGYSRYEFVTIPKISLLSRYWQIDNNGKYIQKLSPIHMLSMIHAVARAKTIKNIWVGLASALTISLRYSTFRTQFPSSDKPHEELPIISYQIQQHKLFPALSRLFCVIFCIKDLMQLQENCVEKLKSSDESLAYDLIHTSSLYKATITNKIVEDVETCRRCCGGHGYLKLSGLPSIYTNALPACTYAGDNTVLLIEFMKYVIVQKPEKYWKNIIENNNATGNLLWLKLVAKFYLQRIEKIYLKLVGEKVSETDIWGKYLQVDAIAACEPLFAAIAIVNFEKNIEEAKGSIELKILKNIFAWTELRKYEMALRVIGMNDLEWEEMGKNILKAYQELAPNVLGVIESFMIPEEILNSVLSKPDPYQEMMWTSNNLNPVNSLEFSEKIAKILRPKL